MQRPLVILQARMNSSRLPGKVLHPLEGKPLLSYCVDSLKKLQTPSCILLATSTHQSNDPLEEYAREKGVCCFRGSEEDVLSRFYHAACTFGGKIIVRVTGDCPLVQPNLLDEMLLHFEKHLGQYDYLSNVLERSYPKGLDLEVFTFEGLEKAFWEAKTPYQREHVTPYFYQNPNLFSLYNFKAPYNLSSINLSVDTQNDFDYIQKLISQFHPKLDLKTLLPFLKKQESEKIHNPTAQTL